MKIGIVTWFNYENYGTALQAVALQSYLRLQDHEVELIDYKIPSSNKSYPISLKNMYSNIGSIIKRADKILSRKEYVNKSKKFKKFISDNCIISKRVDNSKEYITLCNSYDLLLFGSDQIWNPNWYHPFYYANFKEVKTRRVSYAPSFGVARINNKEENSIKTALLRFERLSIREKTGVGIIEGLIGTIPDLVVDPTLLIAKNKWREMEKTQNKTADKYLLAYMLTDNKNHWKAIRKYAKESGLKLVVLPHGGHSIVQSKYVIKNAGPEEFLSLIDNAECVATDSYHALVFSAIFNKRLVLFERHDSKMSDAENSRIYSLLEILDIRNILLPFGTRMITKSAKIDISDGSLLSLINKSKDYIKDTLKVK